MEEFYDIARKIKILELCGELRIIYVEGIGAHAVVMSNCDKFCIAIDPCLSYEQQLKEIWHEAKHICSHLNTNCSVEIAEKEARDFSNKAIAFSTLHTVL